MSCNGVPPGTSTTVCLCNSVVNSSRADQSLFIVSRSARRNIDEQSRRELTSTVLGELWLTKHWEQIVDFGESRSNQREPEVAKSSAHLSSSPLVAAIQAVQLRLHVPCSILYLSRESARVRGKTPEGLPMEDPEEAFNRQNPGYRPPPVVREEPRASRRLEVSVSMDASNASEEETLRLRQVTPPLCRQLSVVGIPLALCLDIARCVFTMAC